MKKPDLNKPIFSLFPSKVAAIKADKCPECMQPIKKEDFRDELSIKEYGVSGMCQKCQDKVWNAR